MTELTDTERETLAGVVDRLLYDADGREVDVETDALALIVVAILTARLARVEALADEWETGLCRPDCDCVGCYDLAEHAAELRAALAAPTPTEVQP